MQETEGLDIPAEEDMKKDRYAADPSHPAGVTFHSQTVDNCHAAPYSREQYRKAMTGRVVASGEPQRAGGRCKPGAA
ncbi:MAG: hypothetical protein ACOY94_03855, partial [Bacillota bacterium]